MAMQRRQLSLSALGAAALGALPWTPALAQDFRAGRDYLTLDKPLATDAGPGQVEVIEFFWYSCPHCNAFEPAFEQWRKSVPKSVLVRRVPVAFRADFEPQQRLFYALEAMNLLDKLHAKVFEAIHVQRLPLNTEAAITDWIGRQGVNASAFGQAFKSFGVTSKVKRAVQLQNDYRVEGVPSLGVAGRYYTDGSMTGSMERAMQVVQHLIARTLPAAPAAPAKPAKK